MGSSPRRYYQNAEPFQEAGLANFSTAYRGAEGSVDLPPAVYVDGDGYEDIRLNDRSRTSPTREGLGSRLLTSLSNAQPAAAAFSRSGTALHTRARSWAAIVPKLNTNSNIATPEKQDPATKPRPKTNFIGDLFNGESAPVQLGVPTSPTKEKNEMDSELVMEYRSGFTERPHTSRSTSATKTATPATTRKTSSSWFSRKVSTPSPAPAASSKTAGDDMLNINVNNALFPHGPADPLSPQAFNDLLLNANSLLQRMQAAYKEKAEFIASIQPELDTQKEEVEEARTRSEHLKMQLADIGRKHEEQRQVNEELIQQLSKEKMRVYELQEQAKSTIRLVRRDTEGTECEDSTDDDAQRRRKRSSGASASDSGFESDADTASVFSAGIETPTSGMSIQPRVVVTLDHQSQPQVRYASSRDSRMSQQSTVYSAASGGRNGNKQADSTFTAWATVERLRSENRDLKGQVEAMQSSLQGVIDFVGEVKIA